MFENKRVALNVALWGALAWAVAIVLAPWLAAAAGPVGGVVYAFGSVICHQLPDRSFHLAGVQLPVCARCAGLYAGAAGGVLLWALRSRGREQTWPRGHALAVLAVASVPTALTAASAAAGLGDPDNLWRATLALPLGMVGGAMVGAAASDHLK